MRNDDPVWETIILLADKEIALLSVTAGRYKPSFLTMILSDDQMEETWRVQINSNGNVEVLHIGMEEVHEPRQNYLSEAELPEWISGKLALLRMLQGEPPSVYLKGVGRRISENVFWIEQ